MRKSSKAGRKTLRTLDDTVLRAVSGGIIIYGSTAVGDGLNEVAIMFWRPASSGG